MSFNAVITDNDIFTIFEEISCLFLGEFPIDEFPKERYFLYAENRKLTMTKYIKTKEDAERVYVMFNHIHKCLTRDILNIRVLINNRFLYRLDNIHMDSLAIYHLMPY